MQLTDLHPFYTQQLDVLERHAAQPSLWQKELAQVATYRTTQFSSADEMMQTLHQMQRLQQILVADLENDASFRAAYDQFKPIAWSDYSSPPVDPALLQSLAARLYNADRGTNNTALLILYDGGRQVGDILLEKCVANSVPTLVEIHDANFFALILQHTDQAGIQKLAEDYLRLTAPVTTVMPVRAAAVDGPVLEPDLLKKRLYSELTYDFVKRVQSGELFYTLTVVPTRKTAEMDGMNYDDYLKLFFEMCDQPWKHISDAQKKLITELNAATTLRFTNDDGTDITLNIKDFTFVNSLDAKNVPGSEVFSGFERESLHGKIVSKGRFAVPGNENAIITNLTLEFEHGRLVRWHADEGQKHFEDAIGIDEGAKYGGEIGIGTNPRLLQHLVNGLLVEKVGRSFHIALGGAYTYTQYLGEPVKVDNGNRSKIHWDITTLLGNMYIDGRPVMENGLYLDPAYDVFNRGWAAVPRDERPDYWKDHPSLIEAERRIPASRVTAMRQYTL